jgi:NAD(P)-dependent dehydrogenase (short-subunit alcohol dehydrogenase family)
MGRMVVTGASRGIGAATALAAARAGWDVALTYASDADSAAAVADEVRACGRRALVLQADVAVEPDVLAAFADLDEAWGGLDALVNNAGVAPGYGAFESLTVAHMERTWAVNLTGAFLCAREAVRRMATDHGGQGGSIVNVSSKAAVLGGAGEWIHYAASKGALDTMTAGLAKEFAARGVRVNGVRPGLITGGFGPWAPDGRVDAMAPAIPMARAAEPSEIAAAIVWLSSSEASYVTGATLDVAGGR